VTTSSSAEAEIEPQPSQLEYASLDLQQGGNVSPTRKTPSPRPPSSCSNTGGEVLKLASQTPAVLVNDGVVYASIDVARTNAAVDVKAISSRQY